KQGGFVNAHWDGTPETEQLIKEKTKATIRVIPVDEKFEEGLCILTGKPSKQRVVFAKSY
ncbi:MAG: proline--tRNA ligase, partial [Bacteroidetes bacterium]